MIDKTIKKLEFDKIRTQLVNSCTSLIAKEEAEVLLPYYDRKVIFRNLQETNEAREMLRLYPTFSLGGLRDIRSALFRVQKGGILASQEFIEILDTIQGSARVKSFFSNVKGEFAIFRETAEYIHLFKILERKIIQCITPEGIVSDEATPTLAGIRRKIRDSQEKIKSKLDGLIRNVNFQKYLQENLITVRDGRYVVPVKLEYRSQVPGLIHDQSASGATLFIEPMAIVEINNSLRKLMVEDEQEVAKILVELSQDTAERHEELFDTVKALTKMDFMMAKGILSAKMNAVCPEISDDHSLIIKKGKHPLIAENAVPIDINLGKKFDMLVITGPNTGGKTVSLKTVGLFTLMFMAGLHVPADMGTVLYPFKNIYADIGDEQSIEQSLSTFSSHMKNIITIINNCDKESLILLDELGAGTDPTEGAAMAMAILDTLQFKHSKAIATTHYSELKAYAYANPRVENASVEFNLETLMPTYKLLIGIPGNSNAFEIAKRLGLPAYVVEKAQSFLTQDDIKVADLINNLEENERKSKESRQLISDELAGARHKHKLADERLRTIEMEAAEKIQKAYFEAQEIISETRADSEKIYRELHTTLLEESRKNQNLALSQSKKKLAEKQKAIAEKLITAPKVQPLYMFEKGDTVFLQKLNLKAQVLGKPDDKGEVLVQAGIIRISVSLKELRPAEETKSAVYSNVGILGKDKKTTIGNSVDLRGKMSEEAIEEIDKFIDDAFLAGMNTINIIHGKGTGALRKAVGEYLKGNYRVSDQRYGDYNEGGIGVTIVTLKQ